MNTNERIVNILLERKVNSFLERTDEGIIGGGLRGLYQGVKKSFNKDYNPEASKQASIETHGIGHTAAQHTGRLAGRALGGALKTAGAAIKGGARGVYQGMKKSANPSYNPEAHKQASMERQGVVGAGAQKLGQLAGRGIGAAGGMIKRGFNKMMQRESSVYDRMTEMLLEARVEMFIQDRLDEVIGTRDKAEVTTVSRDEAAKLIRQARQSGDKKPASSEKIFGKKVTTTGGNAGGRSVGVVKPVGGDTTSIGIAKVSKKGNMTTKSAMVEPRKPKP